MPSYSRRVQIPGKTSQELYDKVSQDIDQLLNKTTMGKFDVERNPDEKELSIKSSMFSATINCEDAAIELNAQLSLLATPFKAKIDESITKWISRTFRV
jgi:hypothetical protein